MTVQEKIKEIAARIEDTDYLFANWAQANVILDNIKRPTILYLLPPAGDFAVKYNRVHDQPQTQIGFLAPTTFDFEGEENDEIIEAMKTIFLDFLRELNKGEYFEPIDATNIHYQVVYDKLDVNLTGIIVTLTLKEVEARSLC